MQSVNYTFTARDELDKEQTLCADNASERVLPEFHIAYTG